MSLYTKKRNFEKIDQNPETSTSWLQYEPKMGL